MLPGKAVRDGRGQFGGLDVEGPTGDDYAGRVGVRFGLVGPAQGTGNVTNERPGRLPPDLRLPDGGRVRCCSRPARSAAGSVTCKDIWNVTVACAGWLKP